MAEEIISLGEVAQLTVGNWRRTDLAAARCREQRVAILQRYRGRAGDPELVLFIRLEELPRLLWREPPARARPAGMAHRPRRVAAARDAGAEGASGTRVARSAIASARRCGCARGPLRACEDANVAVAPAAPHAMKRAEGVTREEHDPNSLKPSLRVMAGEAKPASPVAPGLAGQLRSASVLHEREAAAGRTTALSGPEDRAPEHEIAVAAGPLAWIFEACADADANRCE
jgi:hypothetical protein